MKIIIDCLGGDNSPNANVEGGLLALKQFSDLSLIFIGDEKGIREVLSGKEYDSSRVEIINAPEAVSGEDKPTDAIRLKKDSSMIRGIRMLREDETVSGFVSTGATGTLVAATLFRIGRINGIRRPAFCPVLPTMEGGVVGVCDSGANIDATPEMLVQYAILGSRYLESVYSVNNPRVALLNVGTESEKGDDLRKQTYKLLSESNVVNFVGNMESRDLLSGKYDLVVCDGFSGNVLIKSTEGTCIEILKKLKKDISSKLIYKIGAALMLKMFKQEKEFLNYQNYGGSVILGTEKIVVKGHGSSNARAVSKCIEQAYRIKDSDMNQKVVKDLENL